MCDAFLKTFKAPFSKQNRIKTNTIRGQDKNRKDMNMISLYFILYLMSIDQLVNSIHYVILFDI